jgi:hypothetical protein
MDLNEARKRVNELGDRAAGDPEFRDRLLNDPRGTLAAAGIPDDLIEEIIDPDVAGHLMTVEVECRLQHTTSQCAPAAPTTGASCTTKTVNQPGHPPVKTCH